MTAFSVAGWSSNALRNGDLNLSATSQGDLSAQSLLVFLGLDYTINDNWSVSSQIISITAKTGSFRHFLTKIFVWEPP